MWANVRVKHTVDIFIFTVICTYPKREMGSLDKASFIERTPGGWGVGGDWRDQ